MIPFKCADSAKWCALNRSIQKALLPCLAILALAAGPVDADPGTSFQYQGRLTDNGTEVTGTVDLRFSLWTDSSTGTQVGSTLTFTNITVTDGLFTQALDFGSVFDGSVLWLEVAVDPDGGADSFTTLSSRREVKPTPYAMFAQDSENAADADTLDGLDSSAFALASSINQDLVIQNGDFFFEGRDTVLQGSVNIGLNATTGRSYGFDTAVFTENNLRVLFEDDSTGTFPATDWRFLFNDTTDGGASYFAVEDATANRTPFRIDSTAPTNSLYVAGSTGNIGIGTSSPALELQVADGDTPTLRLEQTTSSGFAAQTWDVAGNEVNFFVRDVTDGSQLVFRIYDGSDGNSMIIDDLGQTYINAPGGNGNASADLHVVGGSSNPEALLVQIGAENVLTVTEGTPNSVNVSGDFNVSNGTKNFVLDHPLHPGTMELAHNAVEGPDQFTFYKGRVQLDSNGEAWAELPTYFQALNTNWDYQLTAIGAAMPGLHVAAEIEGNRFKIAGGAASKAVSWQVTATRNDPWAQSHPYQAERRKSPRDNGKYHFPEGFGMPASRGIGFQSPAEAAEPTTPVNEDKLTDGRQ